MNKVIILENGVKIWGNGNGTVCASVMSKVGFNDVAIRLEVHAAETTTALRQMLNQIESVKRFGRINAALAGVVQYPADAAAVESWANILKGQ